MIALDTNVLVRFVVDDDDAQCAKAHRLIARAIGRGESIFISDVTLCEFVWVLRSAYRFPRRQIADTLGQLLDASHLEFQGQPGLAAALSAYRAGKGDFADYVIRSRARGAGCESVATFDRALHAEDAFVTP